MDIKKRYLQLDPGNFCLPPPHTRVSDLSTNGVKVGTIDKQEKGGSAGTVIFKEPYKNILEITCVDADCPYVSMCICMPEIAPYGVWDHFPFEKSLQRVVTGASTFSTYDVKPEPLPDIFDKNWFPLNQRYDSSSNVGGSSTFNPISVARREKSQPPFNLDRITMLAFVVQNNFNTSWSGGSGSGSITGASDGSRPLARYTWFDTSAFNFSFGNTSPYSAQVHQPQFCFEIVMLDETPHIARNPSADGYFEEYEDEFNVTGRQRRLAKDFNRALASRRKFLV